MRPENLAPARKRLRGSVISYAFRALDGALLATLAVAASELAGADGASTWGHGAAISAIVAALACSALLATAGAYGFRKRERPGLHLAKVAGAALLTGIAAEACTALVRAPAPILRLLLIETGLFMVVLPAAHGLWLRMIGRWRRLGYLTQNVVAVGANENAQLLIERAQVDGEIAVLGIFDDRHERAPDSICGVPVLGDTQALLAHRIMPYVDRVVITVSPTAKDRVQHLVERLAVLPNDIGLLLNQTGDAGGSQALDRLVDLPLARLSGRNARYRRIVAKRAQDLVIGVLALVLAAPVMAGIALAIKLESPGPVFFRQRREGFNNEEIVVWKFRSMRHEHRDLTAARQVSHEDPRITRVGRFIRNTSLDELPQLFNVLTGEMSLVGPRPHATGMKTGEAPSATLVAHYAHRHRMKPGMTGWAAVNGSRGPVDTPELVRRRVELDVAYIERQSFWFDLYIMLMTLPCLLGDRLVAR